LKLLLRVEWFGKCAMASGIGSVRAVLGSPL
jgi:hypothetical protein